MLTRSDRKWVWSLKCLFVLAGVTGTVPAAASAQLINDFVAQDKYVVGLVVPAQNGKLSVQASPQVLYSGQSAQVNVFAHFAGPSAPYGFASSTFDIYASDPAWAFVSDGAIVGNNVLGASASQAHMPQLGQPADPSNPFRVWHGTFTPQFNLPALIEIEADPIDFSVYPSKLTSSSAECEALGGSDFIFVNPLRVGRWLAAPTDGTSIRVHDDAIIDGRIITAENFDSPRIGVGLVPTGTVTFFDSPVGSTAVGPTVSGRITGIASDPSDPVVHRDREVEAPDIREAIITKPMDTSSGWNGSVLLSSSTTVGFDRPPVTFTATVQAQPAQSQAAGAGNRGKMIVGVDNVELNAQRSRVTSLTVTFDRAALGNYSVGGMFAFGDGSVRPVRYNVYSGTTMVNSGVLNVQNNENIPDLIVSSLPQRFDAHAPMGRLYVGTELGVWRLHYDQPIVALVRGPNGQLGPATIDFIEIGGGSAEAPAARTSSSNNLKQLGLGCHVFEAEGVQQMTLTPKLVRFNCPTPN